MYDEIRPPVQSEASLFRLTRTRFVRHWSPPKKARIRICAWVKDHEAINPDLIERLIRVAELKVLFSPARTI